MCFALLPEEGCVVTQRMNIKDKNLKRLKLLINESTFFNLLVLVVVWAVVQQLVCVI